MLVTYWRLLRGMIVFLNFPKASLNLFFQRSNRETGVLSQLSISRWKTLRHWWASSHSVGHGGKARGVTDKPGNLCPCGAEQTAHRGERTNPGCCSVGSQLSFLTASWCVSLPVSSVMKYCDFNQLWLYLARKVYSVQSLEAHYHSAPFQGRSLFFISFGKTAVFLSHHSRAKEGPRTQMASPGLGLAKLQPHYK